MMRRATMTTVGLMGLLMAVLLTSCASRTEPGYKSFVRDLDGKSELEVSTYPSWFDSAGGGVPYVYSQSRGPEKVCFQLFVRDKKRKMGENPHIESILIKSFSYRIDNGPRTVLLKNYPESFWMQNNSRYEKRDLPPIPYRKDAVLIVEVDLNLNGKDYSLKGEMPSTEATTVYPLPMEMLR